MERIFKRLDYVPLMSGYDEKYNDLDEYAVYIRVEDSVIRINYANVDTGRVGYDFITTTEIQPSQVWLGNQIQNTLSGLIEPRTQKK